MMHINLIHISFGLCTIKLILIKFALLVSQILACVYKDKFMPYPPRRGTSLEYALLLQFPSVSVISKDNLR